MRTRPISLCLLSATSALPACSDDASSPSVTETISSTESTTWSDVGPILEQHCVQCHQQGGIGPFQLDTFEQALPWASAVVASTQSRSMPPFLVNGDGSCGEFQDNHWLTDAELSTLERWRDAGAPEGEGYEVQLGVLPTLSGEVVEQKTPDFTPEIVGGELAQFDEYRCFLSDELTQEQFLVGHEVLPGNAEMVHHVIGMPVHLAGPSRVEGKTNQEVIDNYAVNDARLGWPCFNGAGDDVEHEGEVISWAPGQGALQYPQGDGLRISAGRAMVYQVHYNLVDEALRGQSDQTTIRLKLVDSVEREIYAVLEDLFLSGGASLDALPPGESEVVVEYELSFADAGVPLEIIGTSPHMHERGKTMSYAIVTNSDEQCIAQVQSWDFNWQRTYFYEQPPLIRPSDKLKVRCLYDTSNETEPVLPGWGTRNEMCLPILFVAPARR